MTKDAYWFPHDSNARHDPRMTRLRMKHKMEGFGAYWCCIEFLRDQSGYEATREDFDALLFEMGIKESIFDTILSIGLLLENDGAIYSESLSNRMSKWDNTKRLLSEAGKRGGRPVKAREKRGLRELKARSKPAESNNIKVYNNNNSTGEIEETPFEVFWKAYPKKRAKQKALEAWKKKKPDLQKCLNAIEWQRKSNDWIKEGGQYIPLPTTWINGGRWDDEPDTTPTPREPNPIDLIRERRERERNGQK